MLNFPDFSFRKHKYCFVGPTITRKKQAYYTQVWADHAFPHRFDEVVKNY